MTWRERLLDFGSAFADGVTIGILAGIVGLLLVAQVAIFLLHRAGRTSAELHAELLARLRSWWVLAPLMGGPILLGSGWTILAVCALGLLCFNEFARATGLFRERALCATVTVGILISTFGIADKWYEFFVAMTPLTVVLIASIAILADRPQGYIQRVALAAVGYLLFGSCLGHVGYLANLQRFRPVILWLLVCVQLNDVFAYCSGRLLGRRKLCPNTSPNKTIAGSLGALALTTLTAASLGWWVFAGGPLQDPVRLVALGALISIAAQFGDLMLSSIKRDLRIKDMGVVIPGHGGYLDRFDSLLLAASVVFQFCSAVKGWQFLPGKRFLTGG